MTGMLSPTVMHDAQRLWDFHQMHHEPRPTDFAIALGSHDIGVAEHAAHLYHEGRFPYIVFTGANAPTTKAVFPRGEAVHYAERAAELGVPGRAIVVEPKATNTAENFIFTRYLVGTLEIPTASATIISRPYQQRRAYATVRKLWPDLDVICSSRQQPLADYIASIGDENRVLNMLVGDTQRIWVYADAGFAITQDVDDATRAAYDRLVAAGYTSRLVDPSSITPEQPIPSPDNLENIRADRDPIRQIRRATDLMALDHDLQAELTDLRASAVERAHNELQMSDDEIAARTGLTGGLISRIRTDIVHPRDPAPEFWSH
jgi:uncharacterized SAM-binding protein YcdF (DUF218 family)